MNSANDGEEVVVTIGLMKPINLIDKIERKKVLRRLNTIKLKALYDEYQLNLLA
jgi:hypothetical protein